MSLAVTVQCDFGNTDISVNVRYKKVYLAPEYTARLKLLSSVKKVKLIQAPFLWADLNPILNI